MSMFPGAGAQVYRNEAGEPIGWDYPADQECPYDAYGVEDYGLYDECGLCGEYDDVEIDRTTGLCPECAAAPADYAGREDFGYFGDPALCGE